MVHNQQHMSTKSTHLKLNSFNNLFVLGIGLIINKFASPVGSKDATKEEQGSDVFV